MIQCLLCGIGSNNRARIPVRLFHLRPASGFGGRSGTVVVGSIVLCDRCRTEAGRGARTTQDHPHVGQAVA